MTRFMLYAQSNTVSDNMVRYERKVHQKETIKNPDFLDLYFEFWDKKYTVW